MISAEKIPNNVNLSSNKRLQRALEHGARAGSRLALQVDAVANVHPMAFQHLHECGVALGRRHDDDDLRVGAGGKGRQCVGECRMLLDDGSGLLAAPRCHQPSAHDHDAGPLPLVEPLGDVAAGGAGRRPLPRSR